MNTFAFRPLLKKAELTYRKNWKFITLFLLVYFFISVVLPSPEYGNIQNMNIYSVISLQILAGIVGFVLTILTTKVFLTIHDKEKIDLSDIKFTSTQAYTIVRTFILLAGLVIVVALALIAGLFLSIVALTWLAKTLPIFSNPIIILVPVIISIIILVYLKVRLFFLAQHTIKQAGHQKPWEIIQKSWNLTKGHVGQILLFIIKTALINIIGLAAFFIGILITLPITNIMKIDLYHKLLENKD